MGAVLFIVAQSDLQDLLRIGSEVASGLPWLGVMVVLSVYYFPTGIAGYLRARAVTKRGVINANANRDTIEAAVSATTKSHSSGKGSSGLAFPRECAWGRP